MNTIIKRLLAFSLSLFLVITPTIQQANAASSWGITKAVSSGARVIVTATNSGYKSAVNISPTAARIGVRILKGANTAAWLYAAIQIANDGIDFVLEPENNRVRYKSPTSGNWVGSGNVVGKTPQSICQTFVSARYTLHRVEVTGNTGKCWLIDYYGTGDPAPMVNLFYQDGGFDYIPVPVLAEKILKNAAAYHGASQAAVRETATEMVVAGDFDADLMSGAVPISDNKPLVPAVPGTSPNNNGDVTTGADPGNQSMSPGQTAADAAAARDAAKAASDAAIQAAKDAAADARKAADDAKDLINQAVDQAIKDAAAQAAKDAAEAAKAANETANAAAIAAAQAAKDAAEAAAAASAQAAKDLAAAQAANDAAAIAAAEAAKAAAEAAAADAKAKQEAAEKAAEKAKAEAAKPFELPAFCSWAAPVCDAVDWLMKPAPDLGDDTVLDIDDSDVMPVDTDINFGGSCPANFEFNGSIFGNSINIVLLDTSKFCGFLSTFVKFPVYAASSLFALYILGGRKDV